MTPLVTFSEFQVPESFPRESSPFPLVIDRLPVIDMAPVKSISLPPEPFLIVTLPVTVRLKNSKSSNPLPFVMLTAPA